MWGGIAAVVGYILYQKSGAAMAGGTSATSATCPNADMGGKNFGVKAAPAGACCWTC